MLHINRTLHSILTSLILMLVPSASAQLLSGALGDITMGDSLIEVQAQIENKCTDIEVIQPDEIRFPLAQNSESRIVCKAFTITQDSDIELITFSFADDHLVMIKAIGNAYDTLLSPKEKPQSKIADWDIYNGMHLVANQKTDTVWLLNDDAIHPHMFLWDDNEPKDQSPIDATISEVLKFGSAYRTLSKELKALSITTSKEEISPPTIPTNPKRQVQLNCYGFNYAGAPRKLEAVFADGRLAMVWILTAKAEEDRIRQALIRSYGEPIFTSDEIEAFDEWKVVLRKDKPEVVAISDELIPFMKSFFGG